jgi:hypothetical protein
MKRIKPLGIVLAAFAVVAVEGFGGARPGPLAVHEAMERGRLRAHFDSVLGELRAHDVSRLTIAQRASRARLTSWLAEYSSDGVFPLNDRFASARPFFRDSRGVLCAMAYLIDRSGRGDLVERIARTRNNAYIAELADDHLLIAWLDSVGLDVSEAGRIQPEYGPREVSKRHVDTDYAVASMVLSGASLAMTSVNVVKPTRVGGMIGLLTGGITMLAGAAALQVDATTTRGDRKVGAFNVAAGGISVIAGLYGTTRRLRHKSDALPGSPGFFVTYPAVQAATLTRSAHR